MSKEKLATWLAMAQTAAALGIIASVIYLATQVAGTANVLRTQMHHEPPATTNVPSEQQAAVHAMGAEVMSFDLARTQHIFEMTEHGGIQDVIVRDPADIDQIPLIQRHLAHEAMRFAAGEYSDPASLHGAHMPGLKVLAEGATRVKVEYRSLPGGGRITFTTPDPKLVTAIHRWFGAQLSDHGADATYR